MKEQVEETIRALNRERLKYISTGEPFKVGLRSQTMDVLSEAIYQLEDLLKGGLG